MTNKRGNAYKCCNGNFHEKPDWCGYVNLTQEEIDTLLSLLGKLKDSCCIPHSWVECATDCPSCVAEDLITTHTNGWMKTKDAG